MLPSLLPNKYFVTKGGGEGIMNVGCMKILEIHTNSFIPRPRIPPNSRLNTYPLHRPIYVTRALYHYLEPKALLRLQEESVIQGYGY